LSLENGIPSHDTFGRVFSLISPKEFEAIFCLGAGYAGVLAETGTAGFGKHGAVG
jgi:hypothetical protein